ncbi:hypothetical protein STW0522KLE44_34850 [Klebsiella sp. STW0522-44]|nr:hypothetical protein STW0522KLE44_34850 [Klebsiella sp. STW0522-44]
MFLIKQTFYRIIKINNQTYDNNRMPRSEIMFWFKLNIAFVN